MNALTVKQMIIGGEMSEPQAKQSNSIIDVKEESDIDSLFSVGGTSADERHIRAG